MNDNLYFDGDPATESARRHLERVLKESKPRRRWPWVAASVAAAAAWYFWPRGGKDKDRKEEGSSEPRGPQGSSRTAGGT